MAPIGLLAWDPPYVTGAALEMAESQKKKKKNSKTDLINPIVLVIIFDINTKYPLKARETGAKGRYSCVLSAGDWL